MPKGNSNLIEFSNRTVLSCAMSPAPLQLGTLYLVATPIGNLEDIILRAIRTLRECSVIAAEDTRRARLLLKAHNIDRPLLSCHKFSEARRTGQFLDRLENGETLALVSDAGTPVISDPGERIVRAALESGYRVESVPGPCALTAALPASGLPAAEFHFVGFLPHKSGARIRKLEALDAVPGTLCFYESPHRIIKLLNELASIWPESDMVLARELTKKFEEFLRGRPVELLEHYSERKPKGEYVVMVHRPT